MLKIPYNFKTMNFRYFIPVPGAMQLMLLLSVTLLQMTPNQQPNKFSLFMADPL